MPRRRGIDSWLPPSGPGVRELAMLASILEGKTLQEVSEEFGVTRERIRQIVTAQDPQAVKKSNALRRERRQEQRLRQREADLATNPECAICWGPILRKLVGPRGGKYPTCSPSCARLREIVQYHLWDDVKLTHQRSMAKWHLAHPDKSTGASLSYSIRVLAGTTKRRQQRPVTSVRVQTALNEIKRLRAKNKEAR